MHYGNSVMVWERFYWKILVPIIHLEATFSLEFAKGIHSYDHGRSSEYLNESVWISASLYSLSCMCGLSPIVFTYSFIGWSESQLLSSRIWTRVIEFISYGENGYATCPKYSTKLHLMVRFQFWSSEKFGHLLVAIIPKSSLTWKGNIC